MYNDIEMNKEVISVYTYNLPGIINDYVVMYHGKKMSLSDYLIAKELETFEE